MSLLGAGSVPPSFLTRVVHPAPTRSSNPAPELEVAGPISLPHIRPAFCSMETERGNRQFVGIVVGAVPGMGIVAFYTGCCPLSPSICGFISIPPKRFPRIAGLRGRFRQIIRCCTLSLNRPVIPFRTGKVTSKGAAVIHRRSTGRAVIQQRCLHRKTQTGLSSPHTCSGPPAYSFRILAAVYLPVVRLWRLPCGFVSKPYHMRAQNRCGKYASSGLLLIIAGTSHPCFSGVCPGKKITKLGFFRHHEEDVQRVPASASLQFRSGAAYWLSRCRSRWLIRVPAQGLCLCSRSAGASCRLWRSASCPGISSRCPKAVSAWQGWAGVLFTCALGLPVKQPFKKRA